MPGYGGAGLPGFARLAVLGSPIAHSQSPALHRAAYSTLGLDWSYEAIEVKDGELRSFIAERDANWVGLSLTMPLKRDVLPLLSHRAALVDQTGSANTVLFTPDGIAGFNTDVYGIAESFARHGTHTMSTVLVIGGGATAASAIVAARSKGAARIFVAVRAPERASGLVDIGRAQGVDVSVITIDAVSRLDERLDAVISTIPNGADAGVAFDDDTIVSAALLDVAYHPWPSRLASQWSGAECINGLEMLVLQALAQVRVFLNHDETTALPDEERVLAAMLRAVGL
ncbi:MAG TPA: shikimate dehydrogenase [Galbitalea sp.]|jgi:shikimate dehydrogenase